MSAAMRCILTGIIFLHIPITVVADEKRLVDIDDYFTQAFITDCETSPDGRSIAYVEHRWELPRESRNADIWVVDTETKEIRRLTFDSARDANPRWSPDGKHIYFTSSRKRDSKEAPYNGKTQVWRVHVDSGQIFPVTRLEDGIKSFELSSDGKALYYSLSEKTDDDEWTALRKRHDSVTYGRGKRATAQIWKLDLASWRAKKVVDEKRHINEFAVSPDQSRIAMITASDDLLITHEGQSQVRIYDLDTKMSSKVADDLWRTFEQDRHGWLQQPIWSRDGKRLAFRVAYDGYLAEMYCADIDKRDVWQIKRPSGVSIFGGKMQWHDDDVLFLGHSRARAHVYKAGDITQGGQGRTEALTEGDVVVSDFSMSETGALTAVKADPQSSSDLFRVEGKRTFNRLTNTNPQVAEWKLPQISIVEWKGANGEKVEGILELPPDYKPSQGAIPTIVQLHGGPTSAAPFCFRFWPYGRTLLPSKGFALFIPNYRGSIGYGDKFQTDLIGRENDIEVEDITKGVDWLVDEGIADPEKLGVMGWSNGGFLTNALITKSNRFKAASSGAGVIDQTMQWGLEDTPGHVINFMSGKLPWEDVAAYRKASPLYGLGNATTPTLIHVGENDARVPAVHAKTLFRGLNHYGKAPTQLVIYPGAGHSPMTHPHRKAKMEWDVAWFERYLLGKEQEEKKAAPE